MKRREARDVRLIDADKLIEYLKDTYNHEKDVINSYWLLNTLIDKVDEVPTYYDVDKVVEQLSDRSTLSRPVDWSKVAVDTPILVRDNIFSKWVKRYFAKYENGRVYVWNNGSTSWSGNRCTPWKLAKLPDKESGDGR